MAVPVDTPSPAMAATKPASVPALMVEQPEWRTVPPVEHPPKRDYTTLLIASTIATVSAGFSI